MKIESLYRDYVQKSRLFLYPILGIKRGHSVTPIETYVSWDGKYTVEDYKFICVYHIREDNDFKLLEQHKLIENKLFHEYIPLDGNKGAYVFDFSSKEADFRAFLNGKYSQLSDEHKKIILGFFNNNSAHHVYIESYLSPKRFIPTYAALLANPKREGEVERIKDTLLEVGELCSPPNLEKETLKTEIKTGIITQITLDL